MAQRVGSNMIGGAGFVRGLTVVKPTLRTYAYDRLQLIVSIISERFFKNPSLPQAQ
jgi:hypothetical protein